jgi:trans-2-enoyl-CoA reductase
MRYLLHTLLATAVAVMFVMAQPAAAAKPQKKSAAHSMTGCLQKGTEPNTFTLTNVEGNGPKTVEVVGASKGVDLSAHVGHKVTLTGTTVGEKKAAKAEAKAAGKSTSKSETKSEMKEEAGEHHMHVTAVKMIAGSC